ncbi:MAG: hypothetical protein AAGC66_02970 [Leifsonia sp.]
MKNDSRRTSPPGMLRVALSLALANAVLGIGTVVYALAIHGVTGASIFTATPREAVPPLPVMATLIVVSVILEVVWIALPVWLTISTIRGSFLARVLLGVIAILSLAVSVGLAQDPVVLVSALLGAAGAALTWLPSSNRYVAQQRTRKREARDDAKALSW